MKSGDMSPNAKRLLQDQRLNGNRLLNQAIFIAKILEGKS